MTIIASYLPKVSDLVSVTGTLAIITFFMTQYNRAKTGGVKGYFKAFVAPYPFMLFSNIIGEVSNPISMALRLFGNVFGEETVTHQLYEIFPIGVPVVMMVLSLLFCALQAMVYTMLVSIYLDEATETE